MNRLGLIPKWREDVDNRDILYSTLFKVNRTADRVILDTREQKDQGSYGTCAAFATAYSIENIFRMLVSEIFDYATAKSICPYGMKEEGTTIHTVLKARQIFGSIPQHLLPYFSYRVKMEFPEITQEMYELAKAYRIDAYVKITNEDELIDHLLHGQMAVGGFTVGLTSLFHPEYLENGDAVLDHPEGTIAGHGMVLKGADRNMKYTYKTGPSKGITRTGFAHGKNSWGNKASKREFGTDDVVIWSETGDFWVPFDYLFGNMYAPDGSLFPYVNEIFVPLKDIPFEIQKIDPGNENIAPYIKEGRTLAPLRFIGEALGMDVLYTEHDRGITISKNGLLVKLNVDSKQMQVNINFFEIDVSPEVKEGRTFVPLRAVSEAFNAEVNYFGYERKIEVKYEDIILEMWIDRNEARKIKRL